MVTRDATKLAVGSVFYTPWCDEHGKVVDDGTIHRLDERRYPLDGRRPAAPLAAPERAGLDVTIDDETEATAALALQGPLSRRRPRGRDRRVVRATCATSGGAPSKVGKVPVDVSRTGYTGDLGYELWIPAGSAVEVWDALMAAGRGVRHPAGRDARPRRRAARGRADPARGRLHVRPPRDEPRAELLARRDRARAPRQLRQGRLRRAARARARGTAGGPARRLVGLQLDWYDIEGLYDAQGLPPAISPTVDRSPVPVFAGGRQVGRATSHGWSPILKQAIALASVGAAVRGARDPARASNGRSRAGAAGSPRRSSRCRSSISSASAPEPSHSSILPLQGEGRPVPTAVTPGRPTSPDHVSSLPAS